MGRVDSITLSAKLISRTDGSVQTCRRAPNCSNETKITDKHCISNLKTAEIELFETACGHHKAYPKDGLSAVLSLPIEIQQTSETCH